MGGKRKIAVMSPILAAAQKARPAGHFNCPNKVFQDILAAQNRGHPVAIQILSQEKP
jgi:hypothetical protein